MMPAKPWTKPRKSLGDERSRPSATQAQSHALDQLRKGAQSMAEQMMENGEGQPGQGQVEQ